MADDPLAQAGHAALMLVDHAGAALAGWRAAGMPGELRRAGSDDWERLKREPDEGIDGRRARRTARPTPPRSAAADGYGARGG